MEPATKYSVESYQIAVPGGDCSIHLLLSNPPEAQAAYWKDLSKDEQKQSAYLRKIAHPYTQGVTIKKAVLVDGGYDGKGGTFKGVKACESIEKVISDIENRYNLLPKRLEFDAWVVTHWDRDHFCGTLQLIVKDLADKFAINQTVKNENDPTRHQFRHFKYGQNGECQTTLYSPVFDRTPYIVQFKKDNDILPTAAIPEKDEDKIPKGRHWRLQRNETSHNLEVAMIKASAKKIFIGLTNRPKATRIWLKGICKVVEGFENLWGIDVFSDLDKDNNHIRIGEDVLEGVKDANINNVMNLLEKDGKTAPVFLLVGAEGYLIGEEKNMERLLEPSGETLENFISIVSLIIWPPNPENKVGRVSYFNGGDTDKNTEAKLATWMDKTPVRVYKTSHHGAYTATPPVVLQTLKPEKVLISAGYEFGHPSMSFPHSFGDPVTWLMINRLGGVDGALCVLGFNGDGQ
jgi:glyoxylase-like metal-dependent hydrolase (beta-lactamase superfamily II)